MPNRMATHSRHHHRHCPTPVPTFQASSCCSGDSCCRKNSSPHSFRESAVDPYLVQSITDLLYQQQHNQQNQCFDSCCSQRSRVCCLNDHNQTPHFQSHTLLSRVLPPNEPTQLLVSSLIQRLDALESSLRQVSSTSVDEYPLRSAAARVIQAHFRSFLVRRSRNLRQLKVLASLKSAFNSLRSSISGKISFNFELVSEKAMDLLLKVDSVQGGDPMIRDAKRSISNDLVSFLELVDGFASRKKANVYKSTRKIGLVGCGRKSSAWNVCDGYGDASNNRKEIAEKLRHRVDKINDGLSRMSDDGEEDVEIEDASNNRKEIVEKLRHRVDKINDGLSRMSDDGEEDVEIEGYQYELIGEDDAVEEEEGNKVICNPQNSGGVQPPRVKKKTVSFADDENVYKVFVKSPTNSGSSCSTNDASIIIEDCSDDDASVLAADNEKEEAQAADGRFLARNRGNNSVKPSVGWQEVDGSYVFSAPVPAKMESRANAEI
ncbi:BAG family molecular chaperone regulator 8, chloroplastic [Linum perenne]